MTVVQSRIEELAVELAGAATTAEDVNGLMRQLMKSVYQKVLDAEMDVHLGRVSLPNEALRDDRVFLKDESGQPAESGSDTVKSSNRRNGHSKKTIQGELGEITISTPRDRDGTFEPKLIGKYERRIAGFDEKILALYAKGMTTRDIEEILRELYGVEVSPTLISQVTSVVDEEVTAWRTRPLDPVWPIVYFDGLVVHVRGTSGRVSQHTIYVAIGVNLEGRKELLGLWLAETEGAKFWLSVMTDMNNRGLRDIFIACVDGLTGFPDAIRTAYPEAKVQLCVVHLVRAALKYVTDEDSRAVAADLKKIYNAATLTEAEQALASFSQVWDAKYPTISKMWRERWTDIITLFDFPWPIRKAIATTNVIESVNSVIRKFTRNRKIYPSEASAFKITYLAINEASKKWTMPIPKWKMALNHFAIMFEGRMPKNI
jgi:transposase-like protein